MSRACRFCAKETLVEERVPYSYVLTGEACVRVRSLEDIVVAVEERGVQPSVTVWCETCRKVSAIRSDGSLEGGHLFEHYVQLLQMSSTDFVSVVSATAKKG